MPNLSSLVHEAPAEEDEGSEVGDEDPNDDTESN